jgi:hypothetical protein
MAVENVEFQYFEYLAEYSIAICKEYRHGVLPSHIESLLQRIYRVKQQQAYIIAEKVGRWSGLVEYASELVVPSRIIPVIHQLPVYDGLICQLNPLQCRQVLRSEEGIKKHWRQVHRYSVASKRGRPSRVIQKSIQSRIENGCKAVHCQRLFVQGQGSQYFEVQQLRASGPDTIPADGEAAWAQVGEQMARAWEAIEKRAKDTIRDGERDEVNLWLQRTQWLPYLVGMERPDLLA